MNNDVAKHIALYIANPIHEYIGEAMLRLQNDYGLRLRSSSYGFTSFHYRHSSAHYIEKYGYIRYKQERTNDIRELMDSEIYLPVDKYNTKIEIVELATQNGISVYKSWSIKKMIKHYYKSII